jgi:hypothetical protein
MILFNHHIHLLHTPVIEFENHDGKWFQLFSNVKKSGFGPHRVTITPEITDTKIIIKIIEDPNADDEPIGLFYASGTLSYKCIDLSFILLECLAKYRVEPYYQPRIGFYKVGAQIDKYYIRYDNNIAKYVWDLSADEGWTTTHAVSKTKIKFV